MSGRRLECVGKRQFSPRLQHCWQIQVLLPQIAPCRRRTRSAAAAVGCWRIRLARPRWGPTATAWGKSTSWPAVVQRRAKLPRPLQGFFCSNLEIVREETLVSPSSPTPPSHEPFPPLRSLLAPSHSEAPRRRRIIRPAPNSLATPLRCPPPTPGLRRRSFKRPRRGPPPAIAPRHDPRRRSRGN